ncbi:rhamnosyltransferase [Lachnospiraceae bacterium PF1-21]|uniref:glycosyltransferase family 2 protein n=1 Tax=Ohessyouella blattaphilus TaxID=2949333 RepID=UPI003E25DCAA
MSNIIYDVIVPTYMPDENLGKLISRLTKQKLKPNRIIIINTESGHALKDYQDVEVVTISRNEFDHGGTRDLGMCLTKAPFVLMMTQDALPIDDLLATELLEPFKDGAVAVAYAQQLPNADTNIIERYTRMFNYPEDSKVKSLADIDELGIKTFFCSNVCAMYKRDIYNKNGGFTKRTIFNEDMIYAGQVIKAGYKVAYQARAKVIHAHNYTGRQQLKRNFDLAVSQVDHPEVFAGIKSEQEGIKLVKRTLKYLVEQRKYKEIVPLIYKSGCKYLGYRLGKMYRHLPCFFIKHLTMNQGYWKMKDRDN